MTEHRRRFALSGVLLSASMAAGLALPAQAEIKIAGTPAAARIVADHDGIADLLAAMAAAFNVRYRASVPLDRVLSGTYTGSLGQIIARVLDGYSYVVRHEGDTAEIVVFARRGVASTTVQPPPAAVKTFASQWR